MAVPFASAIEQFIHLVSRHLGRHIGIEAILHRFHGLSIYRVAPDEPNSFGEVMVIITRPNLESRRVWVRNAVVARIDRRAANEVAILSLVTKPRFGRARGKKGVHTDALGDVALDPAPDCTVRELHANAPTIGGAATEDGALAIPVGAREVDALIDIAHLRIDDSDAHVAAERDATSTQVTELLPDIRRIARQVEDHRVSEHSIGVSVHPNALDQIVVCGRVVELGIPYSKTVVGAAGRIPDRNQAILAVARYLDISHIVVRAAFDPKAAGAGHVSDRSDGTHVDIQRPDPDGFAFIEVKGFPPAERIQLLEAQ